MSDGAHFQLPEGFLFGVANSPYHVEGHTNQDGSPWNQWGQWESAGVTEPSHPANDFWENWHHHVEVAESLGLNAFRLGIDWARVQPGHSVDADVEPPFDEAAWDRYTDIIRSVQAAGMEPIVTLYHFVQPAWVGPDLWLDDALIAKFRAFAGAAVVEVNSRLVERGAPVVSFWITFNEPTIPPSLIYIGGEHPHDPATLGWASARQAQDAILSTHVHLYSDIHKIHEGRHWQTPLVGYTLPAYCFYEYDKAIHDVTRARERHIGRQELGAFLTSEREAFYDVYDDLARTRLGDGTPEFEHYVHLKGEAARLFSPMSLTRTIDAVYAADSGTVMDYVALTIYDPFAGAHDYRRPSDSPGGPGEPPHRPPWWEWTHDPDNWARHVGIFTGQLGGLPLYIAEASIGHRQPMGEPAEARPDGLTRSTYLRQTLGEVVAVIKSGVDLRGFIYWTLADNYEWGTWTVRLGLFEWDSTTMRMKETDGLGDPAGRTYAELISALRRGEDQVDGG